MSDSEDYLLVEAGDGASDSGRRSRASSRDSEGEMFDTAHAEEKMVQEALEQVAKDDCKDSIIKDNSITNEDQSPAQGDEIAREVDEEADDESDAKNDGSIHAAQQELNAAESEADRAMLDAVMRLSLENNSEEKKEAAASATSAPAATIDQAETSDCFTDGGSSASRFPGNSAFFSSQPGACGVDGEGDRESEWDSVSRFVEAQLPDMTAVNALLRGLSAGNTEGMFSPQGQRALVEEIAGLGGTVEKLVTAFSEQAAAQKKDKQPQQEEGQEQTKAVGTEGPVDAQEQQYPEVIVALMAAFKHPHVVQAAQEFLYHPVVTSLVTDVCKAGSNGDCLQTAALAHLGDLLGALAQLVKAAPDIILLVPSCVKFFANVAAHGAAAVHDDSRQKESKEVSQDEQKASHEPTVHRHVVCDGCDSRETKLASLENGHRSEKGYICGTRWKSAIHEDFDLCSSCEASGQYEEKYAPFLKINSPEKAPRDIVVVLRDSSHTRQASAATNARPAAAAAATTAATGSSTRLPTRCSRGMRNARKNENNIREPLPTMHACRWRNGCARVTPAQAAPAVQLKCPGGHFLREFTTPTRSFSCDACDSHVPFAVLMHGCRACNFDLCLRCVGSQTKKEEKPVPQVEQKEAEAAVERPRAKFLTDVSLPDGSILAPGQSATKTWRISNPGSVAWPNSVRLVHVGGHLMGAQNGMAVPALEPAAEIDLALPIRAPAQAGRYVSYWRLMYDEGDSQRRFGHRLWCDITSEETAQQAQVSAPTAPQANVRPPAPQLPASSALEAQLSLLTEMGFTDVDRNCQLLSEFDFETTMQKLLQG